MSLSRMAKAMASLKTALRKLDPEQKRIARRNARNAVFAAQRHLRKVIDEEFPAVAKERAKPRILTLVQKKKVLEEDGYVELPAGDKNQRLIDCAMAGIRVRKLGTWNVQVWVPSWVLTVKSGNVSELRRLKKDIVARKAAMAAAMIDKVGV
jgi:hypothetical protein